MSTHPLLTKFWAAIVIAIGFSIVSAPVQNAFSDRQAAMQCGIDSIGKTNAAPCTT